MSDPRWQWHATYLEWSFRGRECTIWMAQRPHYCDRGNWLAHIEPGGELAMSLDGADLWPRYYFDLERAKLEVEAWLKKCGQWVEPGAETLARQE